MSANLSWQVSGDEQPIVTLAGELDLATVHELERVCLDASKLSSKVVLDCRDLAFIDSSGLALLCRLLRHPDVGGIELRFPTPAIVRILALTGLDAVIDLTGEPETAAPRRTARNGRADSSEVPMALPVDHRNT